MKKLDNMLKDYVSKLSNENLKFIVERLTTRMSGDMADALDFVAKSNDVDKWLQSAKTCMEFYDMADLLLEYGEREYRKRIPEFVVSS